MSINVIFVIVLISLSPRSLARFVPLARSLSGGRNKEDLNGTVARFSPSPSKSHPVLMIQSLFLPSIDYLATS